ncbi:hypothetical protein RB653_003169 [Dictyostelium firmibasis]|uniref:Fungal lipase-type domain-containing protein n=1 Tax=Dictyostelium firmibasis TaxID=79012 RepID=A0AAN7TYS9_9MYCE
MNKYYKYIFILLNFILSIKTVKSIYSNSPPDFSFLESTAQTFLSYSYASYCDFDDIKNWTCPTCTHSDVEDFKIVNAVYNSTTDTQAFVGYIGNEVIVAFRGSMDIQSWITNFQFLQIDYPLFPSAKVHSGFYDSWSSVRDQVKQSIDSALTLCGVECNEIKVTGHSLGAALATLAIAEIQGWYTIPSTMYNFGSPRVGDTVFAEYFNKIQPNVIRVTYEQDLVPHVPPEGVMGYHHIPTEVYFSTNTTYKTCDDSGEDPTCSDSTVGYSIYDHLHYFGMHCCCR